MITPKIKDDVLRSFIQFGMRCETNVRKDCSDFNLTYEEYDALIRQFEELNLLNARRCLGGRTIIQLNVNAHDLINRGGFYAQEELLKANIEKLSLELQSLVKQLEPSLAKKAKEILSLGANILSATSVLWNG
ncbi:MAG: hypothetical protein SNI18_06330 [Rikenellaceae bacterium]